MLKVPAAYITIYKYYSSLCPEEKKQKDNGPSEGTLLDSSPFIPAPVLAHIPVLVLVPASVPVYVTVSSLLSLER